MIPHYQSELLKLPSLGSVSQVSTLLILFVVRRGEKRKQGQRRKCKPLSCLLVVEFTVMHFLDFKETSTDMAADWIQVNLANFISGTFGTAWDKHSKNGLTFGCLREKKVEILTQKLFFSSKNRILEFLYKHI